MPRGECDSVQLPKRLAISLVAGVRMWGFSGVEKAQSQGPDTHRQVWGIF